jgi:DNA invertase Pin-like site-specific DNA recombinase
MPTEYNAFKTHFTGRLRIARNNKDWHNLLEMCAIFGSILADEDGVYDPQDTNDRLLLGLKSSMR